MMKKMFLLFMSVIIYVNVFAIEGQILRPVIQAPSLEGNLLGDAAEHKITVYLPPSYETSNVSYPVVYFLAGYGNYASDMTVVGTLADRQIVDGNIHEMMVVIVDSRNVFRGSYYTNSPVTGNWEDFVVQDVVGYIDENYRTLKTPESRAISGHSMGGTGCIHIAMRYPELFGHLYTLSPGLYDTQGVENQGMFQEEIVNNMLDRAELWAGMSEEDALADFLNTVPRLSFDEMFAYAYATSFSPNATVGVPFCDFPYTRENGNLVLDEEILKNFENGFGGFIDKIANHSDAFHALNTFVINCGSNDFYAWIPEGCIYVSALLDQAGIDHELLIHSGTHSSLLIDQIRDSMLPLFSENMVFDVESAVPGSKNIKIPNKMSLVNYPNPLNATTWIQFNVPQSGHVYLNVYNMLGQLESEVVNEVLEAGQHRLRFEADHLPTGIYYYQLQTESQKLMNQMILLK